MDANFLATSALSSGVHQHDRAHRKSPEYDWCAHVCESLFPSVSFTIRSPAFLSVVCCFVVAFFLIAEPFDIDKSGFGMVM